MLVEEQHFGRAAEQLGVTRSALAQVVRRMEAELDVPLVMCQSSVAIPTTAGESFAAQIAPLLGGLELAIGEARRAAGVGVPVRIGCVPDLRLARLQGFIGALYTRHPELQLDVSYLRTAEQIRRLRTGRLDLGLIHDAGELEGIDVEPVFRGEPLAAFLPVSHRLATADTIAAGDLLEGECVLVVPRATPIRRSPTSSWPASPTPVTMSATYGRQPPMTRVASCSPSRSTTGLRSSRPLRSTRSATSRRS